MQELAEIQREVVHQSRLKSEWHCLERCSNYKNKKQQQPKKKKKENKILQLKPLILGEEN